MIAFFIIISYVPFSFSIVFNNLILVNFVYVFFFSLSLSLSLVGRVISEVDDQCDMVVFENPYVPRYGT